MREFDVILTTLSTFLTQFVTIIIVAVPEGLPLTITLSLAYSVMRMKSDGVLVKDLHAPEKMGEVNEILIGKTGTLTTADLKVKKFYVQSKYIENKRNDTFNNIGITEDLDELIVQSIIYSCDTRIELNPEGRYIPVGNNTEVALIKLLLDAEIQIIEDIQEKLKFVKYSSPFCTIRKNSATAVSLLDGEVRVFVKGAPEYIIRDCTSQYDNEGGIIELTNI